MAVSALTFRWHRWLGWIVGVQLLVCVIGGLVLLLVPFQAWVKGGDAVAVPPLVLPAHWPAHTATALQAAAPARVMARGRLTQQLRYRAHRHE